jgi:hypothetical protein
MVTNSSLPSTACLSFPTTKSKFFPSECFMSPAEPSCPQAFLHTAVQIPLIHVF